MDQKKVGKTLSFLRRHYNMTQRELAEKINVSDKAISKWENGHGAPDISILTKLSMVLDIDIESILEGNLTGLDSDWEGILVLNYPKDICATSKMFNLPIVEFQLSLFLLIGIKQVHIIGTSKENEVIRDLFAKGERYGMEICYWEKNMGVDENAVLANINQKSGVLVVYGLDFLYGKDITRFFRRIIHDCKVPIRLANFKRRPLSICFLPKKAVESKETPKDIKLLEERILERGIIAFAISDQEDLFMASNLVYIIEKEMDENIYRLESIYIRREYI